jgi:hypothetical protein
VTRAPSLPDRDRLRSLAATNRYRLLALCLALLAGLTVFVIAHELFPYHSSNHDEGVYLQQAGMLLEGQLRLTPASEPLREAFHPWFFVEGEAGLYSKYTPVPAAVFALGKLAGGYRLALFGVATASVGLTYAVVAAAFDRPTGLLAGATMAVSPLFLLSSSVFLPYAPTTALNLLFAVSYVRAARRDDRRYAALAGLAIGLAFFARPYTAVLFAAPFVGHALWRLWRARFGRRVLVHYGTVAALGTALVGLTLSYNAHLTGSPLLFPYEAFAPLDGLGFGQRRILGHEMRYTPDLAVRVNAVVLRTFATDWFAAGPIGTAAAGAGLTAVALGTWRDGFGTEVRLSDRQLQVLLVGILAVVVAGNVYFWGNANILADVEEPGDGLISLFGPFYHFDLLVPLSALAAHGTLSVGRRLRDLATGRFGTRPARVLLAICLLAALPAAGVVQAGALGPPVERHAAYAEKFEEAYAPFEEAELTDALVFVPDEYGEWRNHPFQWLRNDPGFDGPAVYAISREPPDDFAVLSAYPDRNYYRFRYHGEWTPDPDDRVYPILEPLRVVESAAVEARTRVQIPDRISSLSVSVATDGSIHRYRYEGDPPGALAVDWTVTPEGVRIENPGLVAVSGGVEPIPADGGEVALAVTIAEPGGGTLTYREELLVRSTDGGVAALWPPSSSVCLLVTECDLEGTYVHDRPVTRPDGIATNTTLRDGNP